MTVIVKRKSLPTQQDVARAAGVSTATVSRALNTPEQVNERTRQRILKTVKELRYSPNFGARALAARRTNTFGAVIPTMENAIFAWGLQAFQETLVSNGATLLVASSSYDPRIEEDQIRTMIARGAEGILLIGTSRCPEIYDLLRERDVPFVIAWAQSNDADHAYIGFNNVEAARLLAKRALEFGHRDIAFISAFISGNDRARDRVAGVRLALGDAGLDPDAMPVIETKFSLLCGREALRSLMKAKKKPSLVMCGNDVLGVGAVQAALEMGLRVPDDVSITGYDDIELTTIISPTLTTVHVPHRRMGALAAESLLGQVRNKSQLKQVSLETYIVERETLGPAKLR